MDPTTLVGSWTLLSWRTLGQAEDGSERIAHPMGEHPSGVIHYGADGRMAVLIASAGRAPFAGGDFLGGTSEERARAYRTFIAYAGSYEVRTDRVLHHVDISSYPNWVGSVQERFVRFDGGRLVLSTAPILTDGRSRRSELVWERRAGADRGNAELPGGTR